MRSINFFSVLLIISAIVFLPANLFSRVTIGSTDSPQDFSVLELVSNSTMGLRLPQLTTEERDALTPSLRNEVEAKGLLIFNTTYQCVETWNGDEWISLCWGETSDPCAGLANLPNPVVFCTQDNPNIDNLTAEARRAGGRGTIEWFLDATGGDPLPATVALQNGITYWAGNCAGATTRTPVTVSLVSCTTINAGNIRVTAFVNVLYDFQTQRLETWTTLGGEAISVQWQVSADGGSTWSDIAGATTAVYTLPANFIHRPEFADNVNYLYFRTVMSNPASTNVEQSDNFLQIRFIRTTNREGTAFLPGFGITNGVRWVTMSRAAQTVTPQSGSTIRVALLNVGATDNDGIGLGDLFQWGRAADGHQRIVWGKGADRAGVNSRVNVFADGTSNFISRPAEIADLQINYHGQVGSSEFVGRFIFVAAGAGDWGAGAPDRNSLWGNVSSVRADAQTWTERTQTNNPCPPGWRIPSMYEFIDMHRGDGSNPNGIRSDGFPVISDHNDNTWDWRYPNSQAVGGIILNASSTGGTLFLPAVGRRVSAAVELMGTYGAYWSSTFNSATHSWNLWFSRSYVLAASTSFSRTTGMSVRCIAE